MTTAIDDATAILEEAEKLAEGAEPTMLDPVPDDAENTLIGVPTEDQPEAAGPSDDDTTPDPTSVVNEVSAAPTPTETVDTADGPQDAPIPDGAETTPEATADPTPVDEKSDDQPTDPGDAADEAATAKPEPPTQTESPACADATPEADALSADNVSSSEPLPDQTPVSTAAVVGGRTDSYMREIVARLKGVSGKVSRAIDRLEALEGENRDQTRTIERLEQEAGALRGENATLKAEVARLAENEAARTTLDEIEQKLDTAGV